MQTVQVNTHIKYDVLIDKGLLKDAGQIIKEKLYKEHDAKDVKVLVLLNSDLAEISKDLLLSLSGVGFNVDIFELPVGESSKNYYVMLNILDKLIKNDMNRDDLIVAFGGGSIGDVAGFIASIYKRGLKLVQVPTTLLAMVDSAVGGKTALNYNNTKNVIGTFYQPNLVIEDTNVLKTITGKNLSSGIGEIIKYGVMDKRIYYKLLTPIDTSDIEELICDCIKIKAKIVEEDEYDENIRHTLNLGHTIGHAIETLSNLKVPHGIAVATGILYIAKCMDVRNKTNIFDKVKKVIDIQNIEVHFDYSADDILSVVLKDKKWAYGSLSLVVFSDIAKIYIESFTKDEFKNFLTNGINEL